MSLISPSRSGNRIVPALTIALVLALVAFPVFATSVTLEIAVDPFTQATCHGSAPTNHQANVEPDSFSNGSTIVAAYQVGRIYDGGACAIGFSTSTDNGATWTSGLLPGLTKYAGGGTFDRATDAAVAYDAQDNVWMISSLVLTEAGGVKGVGIYTSRSTDGGLTWGTPVAIPNTAGMISPDKNWIVCDNTATSPFYGNCYTEWDDNGAGNRMEMSRSTDGGLTWSVAATNNNGIIGGQPVVRPDGTVIVPTANANETAIGAFNSTNGGVSWSATTTIATIKHHTVAGSLREGPLPSAEIDGAGTVYVAWTDCRFRTGLQSQRHRDLPLAQRHRHELVGGEPHPDRRHQQRDRSLHPWPGRQQGHVGRHGAAWPDLLLLPEGQHAAQRRLHLLGQCGQHLEHAADDRQRDDLHLGRHHQPGPHGRRLYLDLLRLG